MIRERIIVDIPKEKALEYMDDPELVLITGTNKTGWLTELRTKNNISEQDYSGDIITLQLRHSDLDFGLPVTIEDRVRVNRYGDMIVSSETYMSLLGNNEDAMLEIQESGFYYSYENESDSIIKTLSQDDYSGYLILPVVIDKEE